MLKIIHGADFHLDSPFSGLTPERAAQRRGEQRALLARLARLARNSGVVDEALGDAETAALFIDWIQEMNDSMGIPRRLAGIEQSDIRTMAKHADKEGNPLYPVPKLMNRKELEEIYYAVKE